jgi:membrane protein implicated in regulation of membrane protease activity
MAAFLACAVFGAVLLLAQLLFGGADLDGTSDPGGDVHGIAAAHDPGGPSSDPTPGHSASAFGLSVVGLRPMAAALAFFGLAGAAVQARGGGTAAALLAAVPAALAAAVATAALLRSLVRLDSDGTVRLEGAVGGEATVYVPVSARAAGKVHLALQGRVVECSATAVDDASYPTGARVLVVDVAPDGGLLVAADPTAPLARGPLPRSWSPPS